MAFRGILVDRARRVDRRRGYRNPELGESEFVVQVGDWYKARLISPQSQESRGANEAAKETISAELLVEKEMTLEINDRIEVDSNELGNDTWVVIGAPDQLRKKRSILGQSVQIRKVTNL
jgi:hypothetical protein